jgi:hypothetical protein
MMHEGGKSDSPIVPTKPPNEAELGEAKEAVEGRGLAKGNLLKRNMRRIQRRVSTGHRAVQAYPESLSEYVKQNERARSDGCCHSETLGCKGVMT